MIYQYVKRYLKNTYSHPTKDFSWTAMDSIKLLNYLEHRYAVKEYEKNVSEVKEAFRDFFSPVGKVVFRYSEDNGIKVKVFPYSVKPENSKHLKTIVKIILKNRKAIEYPYKNQNDQIAILGKIRRAINFEINDSEESVNKKELIKHAIRVALELSDRDIITQLKRKYIVKIFNKNTVLASDDVEEEIEEREGIKNRFNGYSPEEIEEVYEDVFGSDDKTIEYFLKNAMKLLFKNELDFRVIDNHFFEEKALKIIHTGLAKELIDYVEIENDFLLGLTGYIMRKHFYDIHELMAIELIERIYDKDINANNFLSFYNGKTILKNHQKYVIPSLETRDGKKWNNSSLIGICNLWMNTKKKIEVYEHRLTETNMMIDKLKEELAYIQPEKEAQEKIIEDTKVKYDPLLKAHNELVSKFTYLENTSLNSNEYFVIKDRISESEKKVLELELIVKEARTKLRAIRDSNMAAFSELEMHENKKTELLYSVKTQNLNIDSKSAQIDPIIESIVKVLMDRTKLMKDI